MGKGAGSHDPFEKISEVSQLLSPSLPFTGDSTCQKVAGPVMPASSG
jgi:hypothetical protein